MRFASVVVRNVSDFGAYVESYSTVSIPLYRLVQLQVEGAARGTEELPLPLRRGRVLSAVYRVTPGTADAARQGLALRLIVDPKRRQSEVMPAQARA